MGGDNDDESRQTISADQLLSMGSCSAEEIGHIRLIVAWAGIPAPAACAACMLSIRFSRWVRFFPPGGGLKAHGPKKRPTPPSCFAWARGAEDPPTFLVLLGRAKRPAACSAARCKLPPQKSSWPGNFRPTARRALCVVPGGTFSVHSRWHAGSGFQGGGPPGQLEAGVCGRPPPAITVVDGRACQRPTDPWRSAWYQPNQDRPTRRKIVG